MSKQAHEDTARTSKGDFSRISTELPDIVPQPLDSGAGIEETKVLSFSALYNFSSMRKAP